MTVPLQDDHDQAKPQYAGHCGGGGGGGVTQETDEFDQPPNDHVPLVVLQETERTCVMDPVCPDGHETD